MFVFQIGVKLRKLSHTWGRPKAMFMMTRRRKGGQREWPIFCCNRKKATSNINWECKIIFSAFGPAYFRIVCNHYSTTIKKVFSLGTKSVSGNRPSSTKTWYIPKSANSSLLHAIWLIWKHPFQKILTLLPMVCGHSGAFYFLFGLQTLECSY